MSSWHHLPLIRVGGCTLNVAAITTIEPNRHQPGWCTVTTDNGHTMQLPITADELRRRIDLIDTEMPDPRDTILTRMAGDLRDQGIQLRVMDVRIRALEQLR